MSWKTKPSATAKIERRSEPYLTPAMQDRFRANILPKFETAMGAIIPILHEIQHEYGYIPHQAMLEMAQFLSLKPADILDTCSFYEEFHKEPVGETVIAVCQSIACEVCGHQALLDHLREKLNIEPHETTPDGKFTLLALECLGSCDTAPVALVNDTLHENLTIDQLNHILQSH